MKIKSLSILLCAFIWLGGFVSNAWAQARDLDEVISRGQIRVALYKEFSPFSDDGKGVDVELAEEGRASSVRRVRSMPPITGVVDSFDAKTGWGFIRGDDRVSYFLHRSDVVHNRLLVRGQRVQFHAGHKNHRPRACYVEV